MAWIYILDQCDHAGIWDIDFDLMGFYLGDEITEDDLILWFKDKIFFLKDEKLFIPGFIEFQYGELNPDNRVHNSVILRLKKVGAYKVLKRPLQGCKDKDKEKDKDKDKDKVSLLVEFWNENRGPFPAVHKITDKRKTHVKAQLASYPDRGHWTEVLNRWKASDFVTTRWVPNFDDFLNENKRVSTLEGKYDNKNTANFDVSDILKE